jgi:hypothetical protein
MNLEPSKKLKKCTADKQFWACNGQSYGSLYDLAKGLQSMDAGAFGHHVNQDRNDFHSWVKDVIGDHTLAHGLLHMHDRNSMMKRVVLRIRFLELMSEAGSKAAPKRRATLKKPKTLKKKTVKVVKKKTAKVAKKTTRKTVKKTKARGSTKKKTRKR